MNDIDTFLQSYLPISDAKAEAEKLMPPLIKAESNGKNVPSYKGDQVATGPAQLSFAAAKDVGLTEAERHDPVKNAQGGKDYLITLIDKYKDRRTALIAYNWGQGNVDKFGVEKAPKGSKDYAEKILSEKPQEDKKPKITSVDDFLAAYTPKTTANKVAMIPGVHGELLPTPKPYEEPKRTLREKAVGGLEAGLSTVSAIPATLIAAPVDALVNKARGDKGTAADLYANALESNIYHPHSEAGKEYLGNIAEGIDKSGIVALGPVGAEVGEIGKAVSAAAYPTTGKHLFATLPPPPPTPVVDRISCRHPLHKLLRDVPHSHPKITIAIEAANSKHPPVDAPSPAIHRQECKPHPFPKIQPAPALGGALINAQRRR